VQTRLFKINATEPVIDFVAHPEEIAATTRVAAFAGAWEWRYGSSWNDLNAIVDHDVAPKETLHNSTEFMSVISPRIARLL
jgi:hypothetical protein